MSDTTICKRFTFEASHQLPNHQGKCARLHGHSYKVFVHLAGTVQPVRGMSDDGMVCDFAEVKEVWKDDVEPLLDHQHLNDTIGDVVPVTTAENISAWIFQQFAGVFGDMVVQVDVWETETSWASYRPGGVA